MKIASSQLRIIISQEYNQEYSNRENASHADNEKCAEVFTSIHSFFIQYQGYVRNMKCGKSFIVCGIGGCFTVLGFLVCISSAIAAYRFSVEIIKASL